MFQCFVTVNFIKVIFKVIFAIRIPQESRVVRVIRKQLVKRTLDIIKEIADRPANDAGKKDYDTFFEAFGRNVKLGCIEDPGNRDTLAPLLRFPSSKSGEEVTGLGEYVSRCG